MRWLVVVVMFLFSCRTESPSPALTNTAAAPHPPPRKGDAIVQARTGNGGTIALQGDRGAAMRDAEALMAAHCGPDAYTIVQEGEEAIGQDPRELSATRSARSPDSAAHIEWRIHYECNRR